MATTQPPDAVAPGTRGVADQRARLAAGEAAGYAKGRRDAVARYAEMLAGAWPDLTRDELRTVLNAMGARYGLTAHPPGRAGPSAAAPPASPRGLYLGATPRDRSVVVNLGAADGTSAATVVLHAGFTHGTAVHRALNALLDAMDPPAAGPVPLAVADGGNRPARGRPSARKPLGLVRGDRSGAGGAPRAPGPRPTRPGGDAA